jgi:hypothetical protein
MHYLGAVLKMHSHMKGIGKMAKLMANLDSTQNMGLEHSSPLPQHVSGPFQSADG